MSGERLSKERLAEVDAHLMELALAEARDGTYLGVFGDVYRSNASACLDAASELKALQANLAAALEVLKRLEWSGPTTGGFRHCPSCTNHQQQGHAPNCALDAVLKGKR